MMNSGALNLAIDALLLVMLVATLFFSFRLSKNLGALRDAKEELAEILAHFDESTKRASDSIAALQSASKRSAEVLQLRMEKAAESSDELAFLIERAGNLAAKLEGATTALPKAPALQPATVSREAEPETTEPKKSGPLGSLQAMLDKMARPERNSERNVERNTPARPLSRAERELHDVFGSTPKN